MTFIGLIVILIKIIKKISIIKNQTMFIIIIEAFNLPKNLYSKLSLSFKFSKTFQKLSVGTTSSIYFGAIQFFIK
jgi:hypothetical protein